MREGGGEKWEGGEGEEEEGERRGMKTKHAV